MLAVLITALYLAGYAVDADDVQGRLAGQTFWSRSSTPWSPASRSG